MTQYFRLSSTSVAVFRLILLVAAGFAGPATTAFAPKREEESLEHREVHEQEVICTWQKLCHCDYERKRHASKSHLIEQALRQKERIRYVQKNNDMRREPAHNLVREEQVSQQRAERIQKRQVREQIVEVRTTNAHLAPVFTARFLRSLLRTNGAIHKRAEIALLQNLRCHKEVVHDALLDRKFRIKYRCLQSNDRARLRTS